MIRLEIGRREPAASDGRDRPSGPAISPAPENEHDCVPTGVDADRGRRAAGPLLTLELDCRTVNEQGADVVGREGEGPIPGHELEPAVRGPHDDEQVAERAPPPSRRSRP